MKKNMMFVMLLLLCCLSGCLYPGGGITHGESIEDCRTHNLCYYNEKSVKTEGSDMSNDLKELLIDSEDDIVFYYERNPGGEHVDFYYNSSKDMSSATIDEISNVFVEIIEIVKEYYVFDEVETVIVFDDTNLRVVLDDSGDVSYISATVDTTTYTNVDDYTEEELISSLEDSVDKVILLLDYSENSYIRWFGIGKINVVTENGDITVFISPEYDSDVVREKINKLFEGYDFTYPMN